MALPRYWRYFHWQTRRRRHSYIVLNVGIAAAIANAVYHATGKRIHDLPITIDKMLRN